MSGAGNSKGVGAARPIGRFAGVRRSPGRAGLPAAAAAPATAAAPTATRGRRAPGATYSARPASTSAPQRSQPGSRPASPAPAAQRSGTALGGSNDTITVDGKRFRDSTFVGKRETQIGKLNTQVGVLEQQLAATPLDSPERAALQSRLDGAQANLNTETDLAKVVEAAHRLNAPKAVVEALDTEKIVRVANSEIDSDAAYDATDDSIKVQARIYDRMIAAVEKLDDTGAITPEKREGLEKVARQAVSYIALVGAHEATHAKDRDTGRAARNEQLIASDGKAILAGAGTMAQKKEALLEMYVGYEEFRPYRNQETAQRAMGVKSEDYLTRRDSNGESLKEDVAVAQLTDFMQKQGTDDLEADLVKAAGVTQAPGFRAMRSGGVLAAGRPGFRAMRSGEQLATRPGFRAMRSGELLTTRPGFRAMRSGDTLTVGAPPAPTSIERPGFRAMRSGEALQVGTAPAPAPAPATATAPIERPGFRAMRSGEALPVT